MQRLHQFNKYLAFILQEMCNRVDANSEKMDFNEDWYTKHSWTTTEELDFEKWLATYLYNNKHARNEVSDRFLPKTKRECKIFAKSFVNIYGWKTLHEKSK